MKNFLSILAIGIFALVIGGCTKSGSGSINPIKDAGCQAETLVTSAAAGVVASSLSCSHSDAIQASLQAALGNVNYCAANVAMAAQAKMSKDAIHTEGVIATLVCPIAVSTVMGFMTSQVPPAWGCSVSGDAGVVSAALTAACSALPF